MIGTTSWRNPSGLAMSALQPILAVPLPAKIAGANIMVVVVAGAVAYRTRGPHADLPMLLLAAAALMLTLIINVVLVALALKPLRELESTVWRLWGGKLESRVPASAIADADLQRVSSTLNYLLEELAQDRVRARSLAAAVVRAGEKERARVGLELHESIAQSVAAIRFQLMAIEQDVGDVPAAQRLRALRAEAGDLLEEIRLLSLSTHPRILASLGFVPALRQLVRALDGEPFVTLSVSESTERELRKLSAERGAALYSVAQEAIENVIRHGSASHIDITIEFVDGAAVVRIEDDGVGFDVEVVDARQPTAGLFVMRERIALVDGELTLLSAAGQGTTVRFSVPVAAANGDFASTPSVA